MIQENGPFVLEVVSDNLSIDTTTDTNPVIATLKTIITVAQYSGDTNRFYATPLTTLAVDELIANAANNGYVLTDSADLDAALLNAQTIVKALFGFGLLDGIDIFTTPPVFDESTTDDAAHDATYRAACETMAALVSSLVNPLDSSMDTEEKVLTVIQADINDNGVNNDQDTFDEVEMAVATDLSDTSNSYLAGRLDSQLIEDEMSLELGSISTLIDSVDPMYGSPDSDNDGVTNDLDTEDQNPLVQGLQFVDYTFVFNTSGNAYGQTSLNFVSGDYTLTFSMEGGVVAKQGNANAGLGAHPTGGVIGR